MKSILKNISPAIIPFAISIVLMGLIIYNSVTYGIADITPFDDLGGK